MKLTCDLCGGNLQVEAGGTGASCVSCGLTYSMERLREKMQPSQPPLSQEHAPAWEPVQTVMAQQFILSPVVGRGDLTGHVVQGGIGLGDYVFVNGDFANPGQIYSINDDGNVTCVKAGQLAELYVTGIPNRLLKNAREVTGIPNPQVNAYNYPEGTWKYFQYILQTYFPEYEVQTQVPKAGLSVPVSFMLFQNGFPKVAILLINSNDSNGRYRARKAARIFGAEGVGSTHFFSNYRNDLSYVIQRIRGAM
ncbi:MAG: hypothetical protein E7437_07010 [Ruminococcaceae bacterium]|nr:hypothetical protein [Oscillospiraceae bacterium]